MPACSRRSSAYGAFDVDACFNCGNCTAVCPLSAADSTFPRRIIRYAQVGLQDDAAGQQGAVDLLCLRPVLRDLPAPGRAQRVHGGRASLCHRQLRPHRPGPVPLPAAALGHRLRRRCWLSSWRLFMYANRGPVRRARAWRSSSSSPPGSSTTWASSSIVLVFLAGLAGVVTMVSRVAPASGIAWRRLADRAGLADIGRALWRALAVESLGQRRYRQECESTRSAGPWYRRPWVLHAATHARLPGPAGSHDARLRAGYRGHPRDRGAGAHLVPGAPAGHRGRRSS